MDAIRSFRNASAALPTGGAGFSPFVPFVSLCALAGIAYAASATGAFVPIGDASDEARILAAVRTISLAAMAACSVYFPLTASASGFRVGVGVKAAALLLWLAGGPYREGAEMALLAPLLLEIALFEAYFLNLLVSCAVLALSLLVGGHPLLNAGGPSPAGTAAAPRAAYALYLTAFAVVACFLVRYRERCIDQVSRVEQLERAVAKLTETNLGYQNYASEASARSQKEERLRITRELHDTIGYTFTNNIMMLEAAVSRIRKDPQRVRQLITMARTSTEEGLAHVRGILYALRAQEPVQVPSARKLCELVRIFRVATGVDVRVDFANFPNEVDHELEEAFYAFIQEALTNAFRHGAATAIEVQLMRTDRSLVARVSDDGRGAENVTEGIGIAGMRERLANLGGDLRIDAAHGGFRIVAEVPYRVEDGYGS